MRKIILPFAALALLLAASCNNGPKADLAHTTDAVEAQSSDAGTTMNLNLDKSKIEWTGSKPTGSRHHGTIDMKQGGLVLNEGQLVGGYFIMDTHTITPLDQDEEGNTKLRKHLMSDDFFSSEAHPEGSFEITAVEPLTSAEHLENKEATHTVTGNLTLKGITKSIMFPAKINVTENSVVADAHFNIIRTDWNINFNSDASIKDKFINKEINLNIHIEAVKS